MTNEMILNSIPINVRISKGDAAGLEKLVKSQKFISVSDAVRQAIRNLLSSLEAQA